MSAMPPPFPNDPESRKAREHRRQLLFERLRRERDGGRGEQALPEMFSVPQGDMQREPPKVRPGKVRTRKDYMKMVDSEDPKQIEELVYGVGFWGIIKSIFFYSWFLPFLPFALMYYALRNNPDDFGRTPYRRDPTHDN